VNYEGYSAVEISKTLGKNENAILRLLGRGVKTDEREPWRREENELIEIKSRKTLTFTTFLFLLN
jgi:DNA-directed RNA polymerase specialized sigma24 family protein